MERDKENTLIDAEEPMVKKPVSADTSKQRMPTEVNGPKGPEPTRYGDWEQKGRPTDF